MPRQLRLKKILNLVITGAHGQLVDAELIQAEQLHQHAVEAGELVLDHALLAGLLLLGRQLGLPLRMGAGEHGQGVFHVVHGGGDHRGEVQPTRNLTHWPDARRCSCRYRACRASVSGI